MNELDWALLGALAVCVDELRSGVIRLKPSTWFSVGGFQDSLMENQ